MPFFLSFQDIVKEIEGTPTGASDRPKSAVTIVDCGAYKVEPYNIQV